MLIYVNITDRQTDSQTDRLTDRETHQKYSSEPHKIKSHENLMCQLKMKTISLYI